MAKQIKECALRLWKEGEDIKVMYEGTVGSSDDASLVKLVVKSFALGELNDEANALLAAAEAALASDESIE